MDQPERKRMHHGRHARAKHNQSLSNAAMDQLVDRLIRDGMTRPEAIREAKKILKPNHQ